MTFAQLIGMLFAALGAGVIVWSLWNLVQAFGSRKWETTEGVVLVSDLQRSRDSDGGVMYRPEISYRYTVQGHEFVALVFRPRLVAQLVRSRGPSGSAVSSRPDCPGLL